MMKNQGLWERLQAFELDDPTAALRFTDRLARENGWSPAFAERATNEYKKFIYLAAISGTPVTPSDIVDQVWHLHLTFTRSYWDDMCGKIIGRPLHHGPTAGGEMEDAKYRDQYAATLELYQREFGHAATVRIWPYLDERFESAAHQRWVDRRTHFIVPKASVRQVWTLLGVGAIGAMTVAAAAAAEGERTSHDGRGLLILVGVFVLIAIFSQIGSKKPRKKADKSGSCGTAAGGCSSSSSNCGDGSSGSCGDGGSSGCSGGGCGGGGCGS